MSSSSSLFELGMPGAPRTRSDSSSSSESSASEASLWDTGSDDGYASARDRRRWSTSTSATTASDFSSYSSQLTKELKVARTYYTPAELLALQSRAHLGADALASVEAAMPELRRTRKDKKVERARIFREQGGRVKPKAPSPLAGSLAARS